MEILLVLCHPDPRSLNAALARELTGALSAEDHQVTVRDLYAVGFDPVMPAAEKDSRFSLDETVQREMRRLEEAGGLLILHPDWWGAPPALLKGWVDRVLRPGVAYDWEGPEFEPKKKVPLLSGKRALVAVTSDAAPEEGDLLRRFWQDRVLGWCGVDPVELTWLGPLRDAPPGTVEGLMTSLRQHCLEFFRDTGGSLDEVSPPV